MLEARVAYRRFQSAQYIYIYIQQYIQHLDSTLIKGSLSNEIEFIH